MLLLCDDVINDVIMSGSTGTIIDIPYREIGGEEAFYTKKS